MRAPLVGFGLGGNGPQSERVVAATMQALAARLRQPRCSSLHSTEPLGPGTRAFVNAVVVGEDKSGFSPHQWLQEVRRLEKEAGRNRQQEIPWGDRPLDVDLLFLGDLVCVSRELILPHPQLHRRAFVLDPLCEVAPGWVHPVLGATVKELRDRLGS